MNTEIKNVPPDYKPYNKVIFCGNTLNNVTYFLEDDGFYPLFIGKGIIPEIWLFHKDSNGKVTKLIEKSKTVVSDLYVNLDLSQSIINVLFDNRTTKIEALSVIYSPDSIVVNHLDLTIAGYNIFGDGSSLKIGNTTISNNTLTNVTNFVSFGS